MLTINWIPICVRIHTVQCVLRPLIHITHSCDARIMSNLGYMICVCYVLKTYIYVMGMALEYIRARAYIPTRVLSSGLNSKCVSVWACMRRTYTGNVCWKPYIYLRKICVANDNERASISLFISLLGCFIMINRLNWHSDLCKFVEILSWADFFPT